jgi:hypothetical protein
VDRSWWVWTTGTGEAAIGFAFAEAALRGTDLVAVHSVDREVLVEEAAGSLPSGCPAMSRSTPRSR